ncbi:hypothetical protein [Nonomuraea harbinensis]|uniref:Secreted protein n=1 Tax=Nonomuraea harbinensis TaxID=1286938 RepID=A0ABW1C8R5_9ACTN|nr:hypothetical protein [Nonomuraea harbinensis]
MTSRTPDRLQTRLVNPLVALLTVTAAAAAPPSSCPSGTSGRARRSPSSAPRTGGGGAICEEARRYGSSWQERYGMDTPRCARQRSPW